MRTVYGKTHYLPPFPLPWNTNPLRVVQIHVRLPALYTFASWLGLHRLATRLLVWQSVGYTSERA